MADTTSALDLPSIAEMVARIYGTDPPAWADESKEIRAGIRKYRSARRWRVPKAGTWQWQDWFGLGDPDDLPIYPEPTPINTLPYGFPDDEALTPHLRMAPWHKSPGYGDGKDLVGAHEYLLKKEHPDLFRLVRRRVILGGDGYWGVYNSYTNWYVHLDGYKYWAGFIWVLNREKLPDPEE